MAEQELSPAELLAAYNQRFTDPVPPEAGPFQQIIPEEETYRDMAERTLAGALGDDREAYRRAEIEQRIKEKSLLEWSWRALGRSWAPRVQFEAQKGHYELPG